MINADTEREDRMTKPQVFFKARLLPSTRVVLALVVFLGSLVTAGLVRTGSAVAAEFPEAQMGEALMEMEMRTLGPEAAPLAPEAPPPPTGPGWHTCNVNKVGAGWTRTYLLLGCGSTAPRWFWARTDQAKEILAVGLTAISITKQVNVYLTGSAAYSEIRACYVTN